MFIKLNFHLSPGTRVKPNAKLAKVPWSIQVTKSNTYLNVSRLSSEKRAEHVSFYVEPGKVAEC